MVIPDIGVIKRKPGFKLHMSGSIEDNTAIKQCSSTLHEFLGA